MLLESPHCLFLLSDLILLLSLDFVGIEFILLLEVAVIDIETAFELLQLRLVLSDSLLFLVDLLLQRPGDFYHIFLALVDVFSDSFAVLISI